LVEVQSTPIEQVESFGLRNGTCSATGERLTMTNHYPSKESPAREDFPHNIVRQDWVENPAKMEMESCL
jgi:hypothetical protein